MFFKLLATANRNFFSKIISILLVVISGFMGLPSLSKTSVLRRPLSKKSLEYALWGYIRFRILHMPTALDISSTVGLGMANSFDTLLPITSVVAYLMR